MPDRVLLLSHAFPPLSAPEAFLAAKRMGALEGFAVDVVCSDSPPGWYALDHSLDRYVAERFETVAQVARSPVWDLVRFGRFARLLRPPDEFRLLNGPLRRRAARELRKGRYAAIVSWSQMHSVHLVGKALRRRFRLPWLAHFSDPWVANPFLTLTPREQAVNARLERGVVRTADRLLFTSVQAAELTMARYPRDWSSKVRVLPHAYDPALYPAAARGADRDAILLRYVGAFYTPRTPQPLVQALLDLRHDDPALFQRARVEIVGPVEPGLLDTDAARRLPSDTLRISEPVDYVRSLELMACSDGLLVVDAPAPSSPFLPSKLIDYVGAGRPVAALTPEGPAAQLTRRLGGPVARPDDRRACAAALRELAHLAAGRPPDPFGPDEVRREFTVQSVGSRLADEIRETTVR